MNRRLKRLQKRHGINAIVHKHGNVTEFRPEKSISAKVTEVDYDENGEVRGYYFGLFDENGNQVDAREIVNAMEEGKI